MLDTPLFEQRRKKVISALERAKFAMMSPEDNTNIRPLLGKVRIIERVKPEDTVEAIPGANQVPFTLSLEAINGTFYGMDLSGSWIDETAEEAMIPRIIEWVRQGIHENKLPSSFRIAATKEYTGQDEYGRLIPQKR